MSVSGADTAAPLWRGGWLRRAVPVPSPNFAARPQGTPVELIIVHSISLPPGEYGGDAIERLFTNRLDWDGHPYFATIRGLCVSAHFLLRRDGRLLQFVSADASAWHAGRSAWRDRGDCNEYSIGIELEGLEGGPFEEVQYEHLASLVESVSARYPIRAVVGHEHVSPGRKHDPGAAFDWARLRHAVPREGLEFAA